MFVAAVANFFLLSANFTQGVCQWKANASERHIGLQRKKVKSVNSLSSNLVY